jgi:hypothetical protein
VGLFSSILGAVAAPVLGSVAGKIFGGSQTAKTIGSAVGAGVGGAIENRQREEAASANRAFQERLSSSSYQRAVQDLKSAGINPMLVTRFGGASTPVGATAQVAPAAIPAGQLTFSAQQAEATARQANAAAKKIVEETKNVPYEGLRIQEMVVKLREEIKLAEAKTYTEQERDTLIRETIEKIKAETGIMNFELKAIESLNNLGKETQQVKPLMDILKTMLMTRR